MIEITLEKISQSEFLSLLQKEWEDVLFHLDTTRAAKIDNQLSPLLKQASLNNQLTESYNNLLTRFQLVALPHLPINKVTVLITNYLLLALTLQDFDLLGQLKSFLGIFDPWTRDDAKEKILDALRNNMESLPSKVNTVISTIKDWLNNYDKELGTGLIENIKQAAYFARQLNGLSQGDQAKIKMIFKIYEYLKITSKDLKNFDGEFIFTDGAGDILVPNDGKLIKVYDVSRARSTSSSMATIEPIPPLPASSLPDMSTITPPPQPPVTTLGSSPLSPPSAIKEDDSDLILSSSPATSNDLTTMTTANLNYLSIIDQLIAQLGLSFADEPLNNRFNNTISSYLKGIRKEIELRDVLAREEKIGGMGYDQAMISKIVDKIITLKKNLTPEVKTMVDKPALAQGLKSPSEMVVPQSAEFKSGSEKLLSGPEDILLPSAPLTDLEKEKEQFISGPLSPPVAEVKTPPAPSFNLAPSTSEKDIWNLDSSAEPVEPGSPAPPPANLPEPSNEINFNLFENQPSDGLLNNFNFDQPSEPTPPISAPAVSVPSTPPASPMPAESVIQNVHHTSAPTPNPVMEEIRVTPKIYGPAEELKTITIEDWRRWGTVNEGTKRILDKINLLAEESLVKKSQGIAAWKDSAVNQMYLDIGTEAIDNGLSVEQVIAKRQQEHRPTLTVEEFNAVSELNQRLRF